MSTILICLFLAFLLFFFEIFVPGGIFGLAGAVLILWATAIGFIDYGGYVGSAIFTGSLLVGLLLFYFEIKVLAGSSWGHRRFFHSEVTDGRTGLEDGDSLLGMKGSCLTRMNPGGEVEIDGKQYAGRSLDGYLSKGTAVIVDSHEGFLLRVRKLD